MTGTIQDEQRHKRIYESLLEQDTVFGVPVTVILQEDIRMLADAYGVKPGDYETLAKTSIPEDLVLCYYANLRRMVTELQLRACDNDCNEAENRLETIFSDKSKEFQKFATAALVTSLIDDYYNGYCYVFGDENEPHSAVVLSLRSTVKAGEAVSRMLLRGTANAGFSIPATDYQWLAMTLLHEFAHACNADEAQADKIAMLQMRRLFREDNCLPLIRFWTDFRAVEIMLLNAPPERNLLDRHYGMVEAGDLVAELSDEAVAAMTECDMAALRYEEFEDSAADLERLGRTLYATDVAACEARDLPAVLAAAKKVFSPIVNAANAGTEHKIANRFIGALERIIAAMEPS